MVHARAIDVVLAACLVVASCGDAANQRMTTFVDRPAALALDCQAMGELDASGWGGRWPATLVQTSSGAWCRYEANDVERTSRLAPFDATGAVGEPLVLVPVGDAAGERVVQLIEDGDGLAALVDGAGTDPPARYLVTLDADGQPRHAAAIVPDGRIVALGDGAFALVSVDVAAGARPATGALLLRVLDETGAVVSGPKTLASFTLPAPQPDDRWYGASVAPAPGGGFVVSAWLDPDALWLAWFDRDGELVYGPTTELAARDALIVDETLWVTWPEHDDATLSAHVAVLTPAGVTTTSVALETPWYLGGPSLSLVRGYPVLAWSEGEPYNICPQCVTPSILRLAALTRDAEGAIVRASEVVSFESPGGLVSGIQIARFDDDLLVGTTAVAHAWLVGAVGRLRCTPVDDTPGE